MPLIKHQINTICKGKKITGEKLTWEFPKSLSFDKDQILYQGRAFAQINEQKKEIHINRRKALSSKGINPLLSHTALANNVKYIIEDGKNQHIFNTDAKGRIIKTEHLINELYAPKRVNTEQTKALMCREEDMAPYNKYEGTGTRPPFQIRDEGGHILADSIGGLPESINIFPQAYCVNHSSEWRGMEKSVQTALKAGQVVIVKTEFKFISSSKRPDSYHYQVEINGWSRSYQFQNINKAP
ncbi:DNA/RNA non-specific endonuclease [Lentimicrobium sp. S6]|uniref:DNA/RNA non-specific endonuclease n=1 Tax=Lentimicrobium sp. S6 TaxID=2735872 RepID=UPI001556D483|nr:DNA/RNA non-specific endonuclease [Lentimicrobium sp. S6]NPD46907.1 hypothetical protein [Lentimicrobium sp. S6]